jgi:hypothetical protein
MKSRNGVANVENASKEALQSDLAAQACKTTPSPEEIRQRAYEIYNERGGTDGNDLEDWFQAERELQETYREETAKMSKKTNNKSRRQNFGFPRE